MVAAHDQSPKLSLAENLRRILLPFLASHGAPIVFALLLLYVLWWAPYVRIVGDAMRHVSWVGVIALIYVALQARRFSPSRAAALCAP